MNTRDPNDVIRLMEAPNPAQAHIWEQALRNEGIDCKVVGDFLDAGLGDITGVLPEIWVHRDDLARAQAVLEHRFKTPEEKSWEGPRRN
jgi:hypothetical protein